MSRWIDTCLLLLVLILSAGAQEANEGPTSEKARKTYTEAEEYLHRRMIGSALDDFKKADKQDDGHCIACQRKMIKYGIELGEWKAAEIGAQEMVAQAQGAKNIALAHYQLGSVYYIEGIQRHKDELFKQAHEEFAKALNAAPNFPDAIFSDGKALAHLHQDDAAKASFTAFVKMRPEDDPERQRALLFIDQPEMARARMAPAFAVKPAGWTARFARQPQRESSADRFLGDLVRAMPRGFAPYP